MKESTSHPALARTFRRSPTASCASTDSGGAFGATIVIDHVIDGLQTVATRYAHLQYGSRQVQVGDTVSVGEYIGRTGNTGRSFGAQHAPRDPGERLVRHRSAALVSVARHLLTNRADAGPLVFSLSCPDASGRLPR